MNKRTQFAGKIVGGGEHGGRRAWRGDRRESLKDGKRIADIRIIRYPYPLKH
jgi:hypothetical protein